MNAVLGRGMTAVYSAKTVPLPVRFRASSEEHPVVPPKNMREYDIQSRKLLWKSLKNLALFPIPPAVGYLLFDCMGITESIAHLHPSLHQIIGHEGFGHAGLCFGLHYLVQSGQAFWKSMTLELPPKKPQPDAPESSCLETRDTDKK